MIRTRRVEEVATPAEAGRLETLYAAHALDAARLAYLLTGDKALAEDLVHEAFVRMFGRFRDLRNPEAFRSYLRKTVVNLVKSHFRRRGVERSYIAKQAAQPTADATIDQGDEMWDQLQTLTPRQRAAIVLRYYEDLTEVQTADVLGCAVGTVKSLVSRGLEQLRAGLSEGE
ncbi:MAG: SigE family RNA polymerase sigma factor [Actinomycetota bacterium]